MKNKSETSTHVKSFIAMIEAHFDSKVKVIRSDNGPEFKLHDFYASKGILHQTSCVATPQQNGIVERKHQHILAVARALLFEAYLPKCFWTHAVGHAVHIINRLPTRFLSQKSPYWVLFNSVPDLDSMKVFGCLCYVSTLKHNRKKLDPRVRRCIYLGVKSGVKGYLVFDLKTREIFLSRDVKFFERYFPYKDQHHTTPKLSYHPHNLFLLHNLNLTTKYINQHQQMNPRLNLTCSPKTMMQHQTQVPYVIQLPLHHPHILYQHHLPYQILDLPEPENHLVISKNITAPFSPLLITMQPHSPAPKLNIPFPTICLTTTFLPIIDIFPFPYQLILNQAPMRKPSNMIVGGRPLMLS